MHGKRRPPCGNGGPRGVAAGCGFDPGSQGHQMMMMMIRSYKEFDPSDKLSLGYFSITAANKKEIRISKNRL